ncbi:hypothetical protein CEXT_741931 [Caerostris extrusa]|uniref:Uncharacterized protein n=1 Tax=Caerostris extrusa TaxID=172846 RepID=A0AAV4YEI7_CAEEX|nr:hypothetical protein CEXT_741931 [Caerostris extrusa]
MKNAPLFHTARGQHVGLWLFSAALVDTGTLIVYIMCQVYFQIPVMSMMGDPVTYRALSHLLNWGMPPSVFPLGGRRKIEYFRRTNRVMGDQKSITFTLTCICSRVFLHRLSSGVVIKELFMEIRIIRKSLRFR